MSFTEFYGWIAQHSQLAGLAVFLIAMAESMAVVGLLVPGVAMMFGAGALVGTGALSFGPICAYAVAGAIAGDSLSFWAGWHYRRRLLALWPFRRYPAMIERGVDFFHRYGGRSVLFGRFVGPVRAVIPLVAGMLAMPVRRFLAINIVSAVLWAPAYLLPGMVFGASVDLASQVAARLAALASALLALLWFTVWFSRRVYGYCRPRTHEFILFTLEFSRTHPWLGRLAVPLIDPGQSDDAGLLAWAALLGTVALILSMTVPADGVAISLAAWRHPVADYGLTVLAEASDREGTLVFSTAITAWLLIRRRELAATHFLIGIGFALVLGGLSSALFRVPLIDEPLLNGTVAYGFVAVLVANRAAAAWRWLAYSMATAGSIGIAFARLYSGGGELLAVVFTLVLALAWLTLLGVAYCRHAPPEKPAGDLVWIAFAVYLVVAGALAHRHSLDEFRERAAPVALKAQGWLDRDWSRLPAYRIQAFGRPHQPLAVQWAGTLDPIRTELVRAGWREAQPLGFTPLLRTLSPAVQLPDLPVLPHFNQSEVDALRLIKRVPNGRWLILRFWASGFRLEEGAVPIWLASVAYLEPRGLPGLVKFSEEMANDGSPVAELAAELPPRVPLRTRTAADGSRVILIPPHDD